MVASDTLDSLRARRIGLAFSGGGVRGLAHIGVIKACTEAGLQPAAVTGTSVGSIIGAGLAAGMSWRELAEMARSVFWPSLLHGGRLERFCAQRLPQTFAQLQLPFAVVATAVPSRRAAVIREGNLASAISASCAIPLLRRPVGREAERLVDGGLVCVMPALPCRELGAEFVIGSDVWVWSAVLQTLGCDPAQPLSARLYPAHYRREVRHTDLLIRPSIPFLGYVPGTAAIERLIAAGEQAAKQALARWLNQAAQDGR